MRNVVEFAGVELPDRLEFSCLRRWNREPSRHHFVLELQAGEPVFRGHFPGRPILPGIVLLHWAASFAHHCLHRAEQPSQISQLKFKNVFVPPGQLEFELQAGESTYVEFRAHSLAGVHAQGRLLYAP